MYSQEEINSAVAAGVISPEAAEKLRRHIATMRARPVTDEEHFRLVSSFNDIFVAIGVVIMLFAAAAIGGQIAGVIFPRKAWNNGDYDVVYAANTVNEFMTIALGGLLTAATSWALAEFFTRKRRMALPSIILLLAFVAGVFAACAGAAIALVSNEDFDRLAAMLIAASGIIAAIGAYLHWRRFGVPITIAAGSGAVAVTIIALCMAAIGPDSIDDPENVFLALVLIAGFAIFAFAMRWDISDRTRQTRRADVAFWLHLLAAPMIAHPVFYWLGGVDGGDELGLGGAAAVMAVYLIFGLIALAVDRRALLVSALAYVLVALTYLFDEFGAVELNVALTALIIGSALLTLSAFWTPIRQRVVRLLPHELQEKLPVAAITMPEAEQAGI